MDVAKRNKFLGFVILVLFMALSVIITYKAQMGSGFHKEIKDTWRWAHKEAVEYAIELNGDNGHLEQSFLCPVPDLSCVNVRIRTKDIKSNDAVVNISLIDNSTGETIGYKRNELLGISDEEDFSDVKVPLDSGIDSKDHVYTLSLDVENLGEGCLYINSNVKQGLVTSFNGNEADKTNIISQIANILFITSPEGPEDTTG